MRENILFMGWPDGSDPTFVLTCLRGECQSLHLCFGAKRSANTKLGELPRTVIADAGYGSEEIYAYLEYFAA